MHVDGARVRMVAEAVQPPQALRECTHAARLGDEVFGVDVRADLEGLRRDHDEAPFARKSCRAGRSHAGGGIKDACPDALGLPFAVEPGQQQQLGVSVLRPRAQAGKGLPCNLRGIREEEASRPLRGALEQVESGVREEPSSVAALKSPHLQWLRGVQP